MPNKIETKIHNAYILACIDDNPRMVAVLRLAYRRGTELGVPLVAFHADERKLVKLRGEEARTRLLKNITLAEQMGMTVVHSKAPDIFEAIRTYIIEQSQQGRALHAIYVGRAIKERIWERWRLSLSTRLTRAFGTSTEVITVPLEIVVNKSQPLWRRLLPDYKFFYEIVYALATVALAILAIELVSMWMPEALSSTLRNRALIFMAACAFTASRFGLLPGIIAALTSSLAFNFIYVSSRHDVSLDNPADIANFTIFIMASVIIALFSGSAHEEVDRLEESNAQLQTLYRMNRVALQKHTRQRLLEALHLEIKSILKTEVIFFLPLAATPQSLGYSYPANIKLTHIENAALKVAWEEARVTGYGSALFPDSVYRFKPLVGSMDVVGVIGIHCSKDTKLDASTIQLFQAIADLTALTMERVELTQLMEESRVREEREKLRSMLLSSVSHDLKTPLASVIGGLSVIRSMGDALPAEHRDTLIENALEEAQRLDSFITNILDMTRLESGYIQFKKSWVVPHEMVTNVLQRLRVRLSHHHVEIDASALKAVELFVDAMMTEQVLQNVLDNAAKYTPQGTRISIGTHIEGNDFSFKIYDNGPGIQPDRLDKIFDKYERLQHQDSKIAGTGLGLAIAKMIMWAQGGRIAAANGPEGGAVFTLDFAEWRPSQFITEPPAQKVAS